MTDISLLNAIPITQAVLNVLTIVGLVMVGAFIIVFLSDVFLSLLGNKNGIFFKVRKDEEKKQSQEYGGAQEFDYVPSIQNDNKKVQEASVSNIDYEKAREEESLLMRKIMSEDEKTKDDTSKFDDLDSLLASLDIKDDNKNAQEEIVETINETPNEIVDVDYQDIINAINRMKEEEENNLAIIEQQPEIAEQEEDKDLFDVDDEDSLYSLINEDIQNNSESLFVEDDTVQVDEIDNSMQGQINAIRDDEYYKANSEEIAELKKQLQELKETLERERKAITEKNELLESEKAQLEEELQKAQEEMRLVEQINTGLVLTEDACLERLEVLRERLKENEKLLRKARREYKPLARVKKTLERDENKLRKREAIVARQKIILYGVNNYIDIDESRAAKLAEDIDLLDSLKLSVEHCQEIMEANKSRFPVLEQTYNILLDANKQIKEDIEKAEKDLDAIRNNATDTEEDGGKEMHLVEEIDIPEVQVIEETQVAEVQPVAEIINESQEEQIEESVVADETQNEVVETILNDEPIINDDLMNLLGQLGISEEENKGDVVQPQETLAQEETVETQEDSNDSEAQEAEDSKENTENVSQDTETQEEVLEETTSEEQEDAQDAVNEEVSEESITEETIKENLDFILGETPAQEDTAETQEESSDDSDTQEAEDSQENTEGIAKDTETQEEVSEETTSEEQEDAQEAQAEDDNASVSDEQDQEDEKSKKEIKYVQKLKNPKSKKHVEDDDDSNGDSEMTPELKSLLRRTKFSLNDLIDEEDED